MNLKSYSTFELYTGYRSKLGIQDLLIAGYATLEEGEPFYKVRLMMFPTITYYLSRNREPGHYTIFSKMLETADGVRLQNPVGSGRLLEGDKTFLEMRFKLLDRSIFMNLYPTSTA